MLRYLGEIKQLEAQILMVADLLNSIDREERLGAGTLREIGLFLRENLYKQKILRHFYFNEPVPVGVSDGFIESELVRIRQNEEAPGRIV